MIVSKNDLLKAKSMKKSKLILVMGLFCLISVPVFSQIQWASIGAKWYYSSNSAPFQDYFYWEVAKDTMAQGKMALKMVKFNSSGTVSGEEIIHTRNDSVFYWHQGQFNLMYDFHSALNDTITLQIRSTALSSFNDTVLDVSVVVMDKKDSTVNGKVLQYVEVSVLPVDGLESQYIWPDKFQYIEQIGHNYSGMELVYEIELPGIPVQSNLRCFNNFTGLSYITPYWQLHGGTTYACDYILANTSIDNLVSEYKMYPNPATSTVFISRLMDSGRIEKLEISIFDLNGQLSFKEELGSNVVQKELDISNLSNGLYFVQLKTESGYMGIRKLVKQ